MQKPKEANLTPRFSFIKTNKQTNKVPEKSGALQIVQIILFYNNNFICCNFPVS